MIGKTSERRARLERILARRRGGADGEDDVREVFREAGAVTAATARPGKDLPPFDAATFDRLLHRGVIREGAPGAYYLYENERPRTVHGVFKQLVFWAVVVLFPVAIIRCSEGA